MKILLTGGAGYIGTHVLLCCIEAGYDVVLLDNFSNSSPEAIARVQSICRGVAQTYEGDIRDEKLLAKIFAEHTFEAVLHFAGLKAVGESVINPLAYYDVNVNGTLSLTRAMVAAGVYKLVFSSTASVYGDQAQMPLTEASKVGEPASPYGRSKLMVEQILSDLCTSNSNWSVGVLRYFNPAGAHSSGLIGEDPNGVPANLIPFAMQVAVGRRPSLSIYGDDYPTHDGTGVRDYIHVVDLAMGHLAALNYLHKHQGYNIWNLGTGRGHSVLEVVKNIEQIIGKPLNYTVEPRREGDTAQCWADPTKAKSELGWSATHSLDKMLTDQWRWQSQNPFGYK